MMNRVWSTRAYREGDEEKVLELWRAVFPARQLEREEWLKWWSWMYRDNPAGRGVIRLAEADGRLVGQYAIAPARLKVGDKTIRSAQSLDTMTHPDFRRQGIFEVLSKEVYCDAAKAGIDVVYGFPLKDSSRPGFINKLDWFDIANMRIRMRPIDWKKTVRSKVRNKVLSKLLEMVAVPVLKNLLYRAREAPVVGGLKVTKIAGFDERFDRLWAKVSGAHPIMVVRDGSYLGWRYSAPGKRYSIYAAEAGGEVRGYLVLRQDITGDSRSSHVFDLTADSEEVMSNLISEAVKDSQQAGIDFISYRLIADRAYHRILRRNGFMALPFRKGDYFCAYSSAAQISRQFLQNPKNWLVQTGDSDAL